MGINSRQFKAAIHYMLTLEQQGVGEWQDLQGSVRYDEETQTKITDFDAVVETDDLKLQALEGENALVDMFNKAVD